MSIKLSVVGQTRVSYPLQVGIRGNVPTPSGLRIAPILIAAMLAVGQLSAGINAIFADGFESGATTTWEQTTRYVVFEGFYDPG